MATETSKVVVITGSSSGFGRGISLAFAKRRNAVVLAARRARVIDDLARQCRDAGADAIAVATDVSKQEEVENLFRAALDRYGRIDVWINNAGVGALGRFTEVPLEDHVQVIQTNLLGTLYGSYVAWGQFLKQGHGTLINIASILGKIPAPFYASYTASKHAIVGLCDALRQEIREQKGYKINVCTVLPMAMDTFFFDHAANYTGHEATPIPPLYDPDKAVETVIRLVEDPKDEVIVGATGKVVNALHHVLPGTVEKMMEKEIQSEQMEKPPQAPLTSGSVHHPMEEGIAVHAGRLKP